MRSSQLTISNCQSKHIGRQYCCFDSKLLKLLFSFSWDAFEQQRADVFIYLNSVITDTFFPCLLLLLFVRVSVSLERNVHGHLNIFEWKRSKEKETKSFLPFFSRFCSSISNEPIPMQIAKPFGSFELEQDFYECFGKEKCVFHPGFLFGRFWFHTHIHFRFSSGWFVTNRLLNFENGC